MGKSWQIERKRGQRQIVAGRGSAAELCGWADRSDDHGHCRGRVAARHSLPCGFDQGLLGKAELLQRLSGSPGDMGRLARGTYAKLSPGIASRSSAARRT